MPDLVLGTEWIVDAHGCDPSSLRSCAALGRLFARIVDELGLHPAGEPVWHVFPAFDLYCCRPSQEWPWAERLADALGAAEVRVRSVPRGEL